MILFRFFLASTMMLCLSGCFEDKGNKMVDLKKLDEAIEVVKYNPGWPNQFKREAQVIRSVFDKNRLIGLEHYGSTSVPGLSAKPIVDILVGLNEFKLSDDEIKKLENLGYEFVGQIHPQVERFFLRKRGTLNFNLGVLKFGSESWFSHLTTRDYLQTHPGEVIKYDAIKQEAINRGFKTLIEYHKFKDEFVKELNVRAKDWKSNLTGYSKTITTPTGIKLYTENFGEKTNTAILLISGAMAPARFWTNDFCKQISVAGYFVIRYDHRDMGLSSAVDYTKKPYTLNDLASDAIAVLDAYDIKEANIVGHSMGGGIAQLLALDYQSRVNSITLISSSVLANPELNSQEKASLEKTWQEMMKNKPTKNYVTSVDGFLKSFEYLHGTAPMDNDIAQQYIKDMYERTLPEHLEWFEKFSAGIEPLHNHVKAQQNLPDRTKELKNIKIPTLVIHGQADCLALPGIAKEYCANMIPGARMQVVPGMGHMILSKELFDCIKDLIINFAEELA